MPQPSSTFRTRSLGSAHQLAFTLRILTVFAVLSGVMILIGYFAYSTTERIQRVSTSILKENVTSLKAAGELELALINQKGYTSNYFLTGNPDWLRTLEERRVDFDYWLETARSVALTAEEEGVLDDIAQLYATLDKQRAQAIRFYQKGAYNAAREILLKGMKDTTERLYHKCEELLTLNEAMIVASESASRQDARQMTILIWSIIVLTLTSGGAAGYIFSRQINDHLIVAAKLSSLGQLTASMAHEIRNPLTAIKMRLYTLSNQMRGHEGVRDDLDVIGAEIDRLEKTVKNYLEFARPPEPRFEVDDVNNVLAQTIELIEPKSSAQKVSIQKALVGTAYVRMDKEQMRQAFLNILLNALEAMPEGGELTVNSTLKGNTVELEFKDTGKGIPRRVQRKITDPFFTTKKEGTGLGLFITSRIINLHKGTLKVESVPGNGTAVVLRFPIVRS